MVDYNGYAVLFVVLVWLVLLTALCEISDAIRRRKGGGK